jgi:glycosyltransferase involved in cell wall biosynthesis
MRAIRFSESNRWLPAADVGRPFVRHRNPDPSPAQVCRYDRRHGLIGLSVVIPTLDGCRNGYLSRLLDQVWVQEYSSCEILVISGDPRQGRAINIAAALARGRYLLTLDDDTSLPDPMTFAKLTRVMENHPDIGMAGGNNLIPKDATPFVRRVMRELPRRSWPMVAEITDSDLAEHPCMIMRTAEFKQAGGENELIPRGLDPYLRMKFRKLAKRVVVVPGVVYHHLPPERLSRLLRQFYRNGIQAAFTNRHYPEWVIETPSRHGPFRTHLSFAFRSCRFPVRLLLALISLKPILFLCEMAYAMGFIHERLRPSEVAPSRRAQ